MLLERASEEVDHLVEDPKGDFQLLRSVEVHKDDLEGDHNSADSSYFSQEYLGPELEPVVLLFSLLNQ